MSSQTLKKTASLRMNDDPELYRNSTKIASRTDCLEEYATKLKWKTGERIFDIGCADGSVTEMIIKYVPKDYEKLIGYDISERMVKFANDHHGDERTKFMMLDIVGDLPNELKGSFDHGFSLCTFHWISNQEKAFTNIFNLLKQDGECLVTFFGNFPLFSIYSALSRDTKWEAWVKELKFPYHHSHDPTAKLKEMLKKVGFHYIDVQCKQMLFVFKNTDALKSTAKAIDPFGIPMDVCEDFLDDLIEVARDMRLVDEVNNTVTFDYNLFVVHCRK